MAFAVQTSHLLKGELFWARSAFEDRFCYVFFVFLKVGGCFWYVFCFFEGGGVFLVFVLFFEGGGGGVRLV